MAKFSKILNADDSIVETRNFKPEFDPATVAHKFGPDKSHRLIPHVSLDAPTIDPVTQRLQETRTVLADRVEHSFAIVDKSQEEIDAEAVAAAEEADRIAKRQAVRDVIADLTAGTGTAEVRMSRVEAALVWLIRQEIKD